MQEQIKKWQAELERAIDMKKDFNKIYDDRIRELKQKIAEGKEQLKKEQDQQVARMVRSTYGELTPETVGKLRELLETAEKPEEGQK